jgi:hypothetical protein
VSAREFTWECAAHEEEEGRRGGAFSPLTSPMSRMPSLYMSTRLSSISLITSSACREREWRAGAGRGALVREVPTAQSPRAAAGFGVGAGGRLGLR